MKIRKLHLNKLKARFVRFTYIVSTLLLIVTPAQAASEQRQDIERTPFYDKNAELICGPSAPRKQQGAEDSRLEEQSTILVIQSAKE